MDALRAVAVAGAAVVVALHDLDLAAARCDRLWLMDTGRIVAEGLPGDVLTPERLAAVFGIARVDNGWRRVGG